MKTFTNFIFHIDKKKILESVSCYESSASYGEISDICGELIDQARGLVKPQAGFYIDKKFSNFNFAEVKDCVYPFTTVTTELLEYKFQDVFETGGIKGRSFGILGEPRINVLEFNLALDAL